MGHTSDEHVVIVGGGPGGYESALVAAQLGAHVTVVDTDGLGGSAVLTDCVPSKTLIATAELMTDVSAAAELGVNFEDHEGDAATTIRVDLARVNAGSRSSPPTSPTTSRVAWRRRGSRSSRAAAASTGPAGSSRRGSTAPSRASTPTRSWSRPVPRRAPCPPPSPTASGS